MLKLFRKLIMGEVLVTITPVLSRTLSLSPFWSATKASLGGLAGVMVEVTHITPSPGSGFVAVQPAGNAGAITSSKFSTQGPDGLGLAEGAGVGVGEAPPGVNVAVAVAVGDGVPSGLPPFARSYTSTSPTPVPLFTPESSAVY